jgi:hypothetical protein
MTDDVASLCLRSKRLRAQRWQEAFISQMSVWLLGIILDVWKNSVWIKRRYLASTETVRSPKKIVKPLRRFDYSRGSEGLIQFVRKKLADSTIETGRAFVIRTLKNCG